MTAVAVDPARQVALEVLTLVRSRDAYANLTLPSLLRSRGISGRDAHFATELTYGTLRGQGTYDAVIAACIARPIGELDATVHDVLRLGAHQLFRMQVPNHAAVATSVDLVKSAVGRGPSGFVNAVMRRMGSTSLEDWLVQVAPPVTDQPGHLAVRYSHPEWIVRGFQDVLQDWSQTEQALNADNQPPQVTLVARPGSSTVAELIDAGATPGRWSPWAAAWPAGDPATVPAVHERRAGVQDEGSQLVAAAVVTTPIDGPDERWLDLCAGPGGKAALIGGLAAERGAQLTAVEVKPHRAELVAQVVGPNVEVVTADGRDDRWATGSYDRVLVDVPCSGLGALRRRPEARWRRSPEDVEELRPLQQQLLSNALAAVRPGGVVGYVTCSPLRLETVDVVAAVLADHPNVEPVDVRSSLPALPDLGDGRDVQLWPHRHGTDAMYLALLTRH